jgi:hypothetical protein
MLARIIGHYTFRKVVPSLRIVRIPMHVNKVWITSSPAQIKTKVCMYHLVYVERF